MTLKTGGPAFPEFGNVSHHSEWQSESGMTLRDWFAAQAIGPIATYALAQGSRETGFHERVAIASYRIADAMIAQREKAGAK